MADKSVPVEGGRKSINKENEKNKEGHDVINIISNLSDFVGASARSSTKQSSSSSARPRENTVRGLNGYQDNNNYYPQPIPVPMTNPAYYYGHSPNPASYYSSYGQPQWFPPSHYQGQHFHPSWPVASYGYGYGPTHIPQHQSSPLEYGHVKSSVPSSNRRTEQVPYTRPPIKVESKTKKVTTTTTTVVTKNHAKASVSNIPKTPLSPPSSGQEQEVSIILETTERQTSPTTTISRDIPEGVNANGSTMASKTNEEVKSKCPMITSKIDEEAKGSTIPSKIDKEVKAKDTVAAGTKWKKAMTAEYTGHQVSWSPQDAQMANLVSTSPPRRVHKSHGKPSLAVMKRLEHEQQEKIKQQEVQKKKNQVEIQEDALERGKRITRSRGR